jgi:hypothetical protein
MGAYCPAPVVDEEMLHWIEGHVLVPTVHAMKRARRPFRGVLYAGMMLTPQGPKVLEYNVRFGDPECQPLLMRLKTDLVDLLEATIDGRLEEIGAPGGIRAAVSSSWRRKVIRQLSQGRDPRLGRRDRLSDVGMFHAHAPRCATDNRSPAAAGCWRDRGWATTSPRPSCRPTPP